VVDLFPIDILDHVTSASVYFAMAMAPSNGINKKVLCQKESRHLVAKEAGRWQSLTARLISIALTRSLTGRWNFV